MSDRLHSFKGPQPLGRIVRVFSGHENVLQSAEVKTKLGVLKHPVMNLAMLEAWSPISIGRTRGEEVTAAEHDIYLLFFLT